MSLPEWTRLRKRISKICESRLPRLPGRDLSLGLPTLTTTRNGRTWPSCWSHQIETTYKPDDVHARTSQSRLCHLRRAVASSTATYKTEGVQLSCFEPSPNDLKARGSGSGTLRLEMPRSSSTMRGVATWFPAPTIMPSQIQTNNLRLSSYFRTARESIVFFKDSSFSLINLKLSVLHPTTASL